MTIHIDATSVPAGELAERELTPPSAQPLPIGWRGIWTVHETLRKVYAVYK